MSVTVVPWEQPEPDRWGASPEEWAHFDLMLGLTADVLPVVSNPGAQISPDSKMKGLGKTPSAYNSRGFVAGIKDWTDRQTTPRQIEKWSAQGDYGICLQTRTVRACDIDVPDRARSDEIAALFARELGLRCPCRRRADSGKQLLVFVVVGADDLRKRSFRVEGGLVEFLATGQQFVAVGTHTDGARYEWVGGLPRAIPEVSLEDFERAWAAIRDRYAIEPERRSQRREGTGEGDATDETASWLEANWETYGSDGEKLFLLCPFKDGHSGDSGETEAAWLLAGTAGYAQGHFACLHASCSGRKDSEFFQAVGLKPAQASDFTPVPREAQERVMDDPVALYLAAAADLAPPAAGASTKAKKTAPHPTGVPALPLPGFERDKQGVILATLGNLAKALGHAQMTGHRLKYDTFRGELVITSEGGDTWRPFRDADAVRLRIALAERGMEQIGKELMRDALTLAAVENEFDGATHWLESLPEWDGVERIARFYPDYFKTDDTPYTRAVGLYVWTAHVGRVMEPGCQADMAPILIGDQGLRKSSGIMAISPSLDFYKKFNLADHDADQSRKMRGVLVGEFDEMRGLNGRGAEEIRSFMTKRWEDWTPKYQEYETKFARRMIFHGSGNEDEILNDPTGERRWLPMTVHAQVDVERIEADRDQLWAEGLAQWTGYGVRWQEAERLGKAEHAAFKVSDPWDKDVARWLGETDLAGLTPAARGTMKAADVLIGALGFEVGRIGKADEMRMARVLTAHGYRRVITKLNDKTAKVWVRENEG